MSEHGPPIDLSESVLILRALVAAQDRIVAALGDSLPEFRRGMLRIVERLLSGDEMELTVCVDELLDLGLHSAAQESFRSILARSLRAEVFKDRGFDVRATSVEAEAIAGPAALKQAAFDLKRAFAPPPISLEYTIPGAEQPQPAPSAPPESLAFVPPEPSAPPPPRARYLNAGFFAKSGQKPLPVDQPLSVSTAHYRLGVNVGAFWGPGSPSAPIPDEILSPEFERQSVLEFAVVPRSNTVGISPLMATVAVPRCGDSPLVFFELTFVAGRQAIDVDLIYKGHLIQSRRTEVLVLAQPDQPVSVDPVQDGYITFTRTAALDADNLQPLQERPSRLTIVAQRDLDYQRIGLHFYNATGADLGMQQSNLTDASLAPVMAKVRDQLAATMQAYSGALGSTREVLQKYLGQLASVGREFYLALLPGLARGATSSDQGQQLGIPLTPGQVIQVAPLSAQVSVPWELLYERKLESYRADRTRLCATFLQHGAELEACPSNADPTVVCPYGFWGYRYVIEQLPARVKPHAPLPNQGLALRIPNSAPLHMNAVVYTGFTELAAHLDRLRALAPQTSLEIARIDTLDGTRAALSDAASLAEIVYFYSHGGSDKYGSPYVEVGSGDRVTLIDLNAWGVQLKGPIVILNACDSADYSPDTFENLIQFLCDNGAAGVIGTQCEVKERLAGAFVLCFLQAFLRQKSAGDALFEARMALLTDDSPDPRGLVYSLFAAADLQLARPVLT